MTDFVSRILAATQPPTVRPMVPSIFEPAVELDPAPPVLDRPGPADVSGPPAPPAQVASENAPVVAEESVPAPRAESRPAVLTTHAQEQARPAPADLRTADPVRPTERQPVPDAVTRPASPPTPTRAGTTAHPAPARHPATAATPPATAQPDGPAPAVTGHPVAAAEPAHLAPSAAVGNRVNPAPAARLLQRGNADAERTVHISIGRVDVRAQQPAPTPPAPTRAAPRRQPVLSLQDYLAGRAGSNGRR